MISTEIAGQAVPEIIEPLLKLARPGSALTSRIGRIAQNLLGRPYLENGLAGGPYEEEVLTASVQAFDCVTYIETVLALARSRTTPEFVQALRWIRYRNGRVSWWDRNHYMTGWARNNSRTGLVEDITSGAEAIRVRRTLSLVGGIPATGVKFRCFPRRMLRRVEPRLRDGDIILFVSMKPSLDVFHAGLLFRRRGILMMRHATRTKGRVVEQPLSAFVRTNRMHGFIVLRPRAGRKLAPIAARRLMPLSVTSTE